MPRAISPSKQRRIQGALQEDISQKEIAKRVGCSKRQVTRIKHNLVNYGTTTRPKKPQQGRQPKITEAMAQVYLFDSKMLMFAIRNSWNI